MRFDPIRHRLMRDAERAPNPPEIHPIDIQREGLPTDRFRITLQLGFRRLFPLTRFTEIPLAPRRVLPDFELPVGAGAMGTLHGMSLPSTLSFCHSPQSQTCAGYCGWARCANWRRFQAKIKTLTASCNASSEREKQRERRAKRTR